MQEKVRDANAVAARTALLILILDLVGVSWFMEQPVNSLLDLHPAFAFYRSCREFYRATVCQDAFGAATRKPTWVFSNDERVMDLKKYALQSCRAGDDDTSLTTKRRRVDGSTSVTGVKAGSMHVSAVCLFAYMCMIMRNHMDFKSSLPSCMFLWIWLVFLVNAILMMLCRLTCCDRQTSELQQPTHGCR